MNWADSVPNLLIGLREGLEAGLVVTILLAAVRKIPGVDQERGVTAPVWLGVLGAVMLSGSFAAVLTYSTDVLSSTGQQAVGGLLSVLAVGLVTWMIFWMRRTARTLSAHIKEEVARAAVIGAGALTLTAFLSASREGLETTLFLWTAAQASGQTVGPLAGAAIGIAAAIALCWGLYKRAVRLNIGVFFSRTAIALIAIAAGVLAYGLGDLQDAGLLPGHTWLAFDLTGHVDPGSWWASIITGITELSPKMTVLQVTTGLAYLIVVLWMFISPNRAAQPAPASAPAVIPAPAATPAPAAAGQERPAGLLRSGTWERLAGQRTRAVAGVLVAVPALAAGATIAALPAARAASSTVTVTNTSCGADFTTAPGGTQTFTVKNTARVAGEISLVNASDAIVGEIENLGPATRTPLPVTLASGTYTFKCFMSGKPVTASAPVDVTGTTTAITGVAVKPVTLADLTSANDQYEAYAAGVLARLAGDVARIQADVKAPGPEAAGLAAARTDWLAAQLEWERVGASYDSFGDLGLAVDGLPNGLPKGVNDPGFTGLHRLEYGLWHGQSAATLLPAADRLATDVATVRAHLSSDDLAGDPANLPVRAHEILEDALRDHLSGVDDQGAGAAYPMTYADLQVTRVMLGELTGLINARQPGLLATINSQQAALEKALLATRSGAIWPSPAQAPLPARQAVNAATGQLLETLSSVPDLLEVRPAG